MSDHSVSVATPDCPARRGQPPDEALLESFVRGELPEAEQDWWEAHLDHCSACQARLDALTGPPLPYVPESVQGASILMARMGPAQAPARALARVREQLQTHGWRVSEPMEPVVWAVYDTSSQSIEGSPVDARRVVQGLRMLQDLVQPSGPVGAWLEVGRGILGLQEVWGRTFQRGIQVSEADHVLKGRIRVSSEVQGLLDGLGLHFQVLAEGAELLPFSPILQRVSLDDPSLSAQPGFWSGLLDGALSNLFSFAPQLSLSSRKRGSTQAQTPSTATSTPLKLDASHRLQLELSPQPGLASLLVWETEQGCRLAPESTGISATPSATIRLWPSVPTDTTRATLWLLVVPEERRARALEELRQATVTPITAETLAAQLHARLVGQAFPTDLTATASGFALLKVEDVER